MTTQGLKRKLAVILSAEVKGYSRLMGEDEDRNDFLTKLGLPGRG